MTIFYRPDETKVPDSPIDWEGVMRGYRGIDGIASTLIAGAAVRKHKIPTNKQVIAVLINAHESLGGMFPEKAQAVFRIMAQEKAVYDQLYADAKIKDKDEISKQVDRIRTAAMTEDIRDLEELDMKICFTFHGLQRRLVSAAERPSPKGIFASLFSFSRGISPKEARDVLGSVVGWASEAFNKELEPYGVKMLQLVPINYEKKIEAAREGQATPASRYYH